MNIYGILYNILRDIDPMTSLMQSIRKQYLLSIDRTHRFTWKDIPLHFYQI